MSTENCQDCNSAIAKQCVELLESHMKGYCYVAVKDDYKSFIVGRIQHDGSEHPSDVYGTLCIENSQLDSWHLSTLNGKAQIFHSCEDVFIAENSVVNANHKIMKGNESQVMVMINAILITCAHLSSLESMISEMKSHLF